MRRSSPGAKVAVDLMFCFESKLGRIKKELEKLNLNAFSDFRKRMDKAKKNLENIQKLLMVDP